MEQLSTWELVLALLTNSTSMNQKPSGYLPKQVPIQIVTVMETLMLENLQRQTLTLILYHFISKIDWGSDPLFSFLYQLQVSGDWLLWFT